MVLSGCSSNRLAPDARTILDRADEIELLSLDPDRDSKAKYTDTFHGYGVMGKTTLSASVDRAKLLKALYQGIHTSDGMVAACFIPRHGIQATHDGKTVHLVICFQCMQIHVYVDGRQSSVLTTSAPASVFNQILTDAGVPLPKQPGA
jgi:hypothetical protein